MTRQNDDAGDAGHDDSPRQDTQRPDHRDAQDAGGHESRNDALKGTQARPEARPAGAPGAPGGSRRDPALPAGGRQPQRPGQDGRHEPRLGARDPDTLKPSDE
jgi:hypothetical protein